jgi:hypothetical protein
MSEPRPAGERAPISHIFVCFWAFLSDPLADLTPPRNDYPLPWGLGVTFLPPPRPEWQREGVERY